MSSLKNFVPPGLKWLFCETVRARIIRWTGAIVIAIVVALCWLSLSSQLGMRDDIEQSLTSLTSDLRSQQQAALDEVSNARKAAALSALRDKAESLAQILAKLAPAPLLTYETTVLDEYCRQISLDADVVLTFVADSEGEVRTTERNLEDQGLLSLIETPDSEIAIADLSANLIATGGVIETRIPILQDGESLGEAVVLLSNARQAAADQDFANLQTAMSQMLGEVQQELNGAMKEKTRSSAIQCVFAGAIALILGGFVACLIARSITKPTAIVSNSLENLACGTRQIADLLQNHLARGDWSIDAQIKLDEHFVDELQLMTARNDEMGDMCRAGKDIFKAIESAATAMNICIGQVGSALKEVAMSVSQVNTGAEQTSAASTALSQDATDQASTLEQITASMTEIGGQIRNNAKNADQANQLSHNTNQAAGSGQALMHRLTDSMERITANGEQVTMIVRTIDEIAFQTNLLALNAAVEAARAGTDGKGFAVVAEEVRNLAARSAKAAQEAALLIEGSNSDISDGVEISKQTSDALDEIVDHAAKVSHLIDVIASACNEQSQGVTQINQGLDQIDQVTQQVAANSEQTAATSEQMSHQAGSLQSLVSKFKLKGEQAQLKETLVF